MRELTIAGRRIADDTPAWVIAELGHNHGGSVERCTQMIQAAARAGADAVKLQKRDNRALYTSEAYNRPYVSENSFGATYGEHREALELPIEDYVGLDRHADQAGVVFFATPFDCKSADELAMRTRCPVFKIASCDIVNLPLIRHVASYHRPMILSTGAASIADVDRALETVLPINKWVALLQCTARYPAPASALNLRVITTYRERYPELVIGLSSHYSGVADVVAAYALGARIFEKHFTLDRTLKGTDHAFSLEMGGFGKMTSYLRNVHQMMGDGVKALHPEEQGAIDKMRKATRWYAEQYEKVAA